MAEDKELKDWYNKDSSTVDESTVSIQITSDGTTTQTKESDIKSPTVDDLNTVPVNSPQTDIQQEVISKMAEPELTTKNDAVISMDMTNVHKTYGLLVVIESKLKEYHALAGAQEGDPIRKEGLASDLKSLTRDLADIVGSL